METEYQREFKKLALKAKNGTLPKNFKNWDLSYDGMQSHTDMSTHILYTHDITLAHIAAEYGTLPKDFNQWDLIDKKGKTVRQVLLERENEYRPS